MYSRPDPFVAEEAVNAALPTTEPDTLAEMGEVLLDICRSAAVAKGVPLPARQVVYMTQIPADCEQVAAIFSGWTPFPIPEGPTICLPFRWQAGFSVLITRCTPAVQKTKNPPTPEKMLEAAKIASADSEVLLELVNRLNEIGSDVGITAMAPSGGFQTTELTVTLMSVGSL